MLTHTWWKRGSLMKRTSGSDAKVELFIESFRGYIDFYIGEIFVIMVKYALWLF